ncbi:MAG: GIY-YIG nuclease family protein [Phycisphaerae bacterium]|nr:GIY-YIG nuclease family protein [Phycisphaerae bacterium]
MKKLSETPWVAMPDKSVLDMLPSEPGIYFLEYRNQLLYIGVSKSIKHRWRQHFKQRENVSINRNMYVRYGLMNIKLAARLERVLIRELDPSWNNGVRPYGERRAKKAVQLSISIDENLLARINDDARKEGQGRSFIITKLLSEAVETRRRRTKRRKAK